MIQLPFFSSQTLRQASDTYDLWIWLYNFLFMFQESNIFTCHHSSCIIFKLMWNSCTECHFGSSNFFFMLICSLSLVCDFQFYFLKGELTAHPKSSGPLYPKVYPYDIGNTIPFCYRDNTRKTWKWHYRQVGVSGPYLNSTYKYQISLENSFHCSCNTNW